MNIATFIIKNTWRNKRRAALTSLSVAVSLFLLTTLLTALRELTVPPEDVGASLRIAVRNKISLANTLPAKQRGNIQKIPGVALVSPLTFFGGRFKEDDGIGFAQFGLDADLLIGIFGEANLPPEQFDAFKKDRRACLVGRDSATRHGMKIGDRITVKGGIYPCDLDLILAGIYYGTIDDRNLYFHHTFLDEAMGNWGQVGTWWVKVKSAEQVPEVIRAINATFANTSAEVLAETERSFQLGFISMLGNVTAFIGVLSSVVVFTLALVTTSTMSLTIRERFRELAILKALGFKNGEIAAFILAESFMLSAAGALLGVGGGWLLYSKMSVSQATAGIFPFFEVTPQIAGAGCFVAVILSLISAVPPIISACQLTVVDGLKTLD